MKFFKSINFRLIIMFYMISWFLIPISNNMYCQDLNDVFKIDNENLEQKQIILKSENNSITDFYNNRPKILSLNNDNENSGIILDEIVSSIKSKTESFNKEMQIWSDNYWGKIGLKYHRDKWIYYLNENIQPQFRDLYKFTLKSINGINENLIALDEREYIRAFKKVTIFFYDDWYDSILKNFMIINTLNKTLNNCDFQFDISTENRFKFDSKKCEEDFYNLISKISQSQTRINYNRDLYISKNDSLIKKYLR